MNNYDTRKKQRYGCNVNIIIPGCLELRVLMHMLIYLYTINNCSDKFIRTYEFIPHKLNYIGSCDHINLCLIFRLINASYRISINLFNEETTSKVNLELFNCLAY